MTVRGSPRIQDGKDRSGTTRLVAGLGWALAVAVFFSVGWIYPDDVTWASMRQAAGLGSVFAVAPTSVWLWHSNTDFVFLVGSGWFIAAAVTSFGGNGLMVAGVLYGLVLMITSGTARPNRVLFTIGLLAMTTLFIAAVLLALDGRVSTGLAALVLAALVVSRGGLPLSRSRQRARGSS